MPGKWKHLYAAIMIESEFLHANKTRTIYETKKWLASSRQYVADTGQDQPSPARFKFLKICSCPGTAGGLLTCWNHHAVRTR